MDHEDAAAWVIEDAARVVLPGAKTNVVAQARHDFARHGHCDGRLIAVIEKAIEARLAQWSLEDKRGIWEGLRDSGAFIDPEVEFDDYPEDSIDLTLEPELLHLITGMLSPTNSRTVDSVGRDEAPEA
jgi:hypothetical protein